MSVAEAEVLMYLSLLHCPIFGGLEHPHSQIPHSTDTDTDTDTDTSQREIDVLESGPCSVTLQLALVSREKHCELLVRCLWLSG